MSSVYEALQRAREGGREPPALSQSQPISQPISRPISQAVPQPVPGRPPPRPAVSLAPGPIAMALTPLLAAVRPLLDNHQGGHPGSHSGSHPGSRRGAVVQIVAAAPGEGASTVAREFALLAGGSGHRKTLLVDADLRNPTTAKAFGCHTGPALIDALAEGGDGGAALHAVPGTQTAVARLVGERSAGEVDADALRSLYEALRGHFELTVIDCPPIADNAYSDLLPEATDGVIMVIEAEATRPAVVAHAKAQIENTGANLLGAVLNRRSNYIPNFIYRLL